MDAFANGAILLAAFPTRALSTGETTGWYVAFERGPDDIAVGSSFHRWGSAWMRTLDELSWSGGEWFSEEYDAVASAMERAGWLGVAGKLYRRLHQAARG